MEPKYVPMINWNFFINKWEVFRALAKWNPLTRLWFPFDMENLKK